MNDEEMTEKLNEITFCDECPYSGEPNGCNRKEGVCKAHESYFDLVKENAVLKRAIEIYRTTCNDIRHFDFDIAIRKAKEWIFSR